jgi:predicted phage terminase large subunit-like protein
VIGRKVYLLDVFRKRLNFHQVAPAIRSMQTKYNATFVILEITGLCTAIGQQLCTPRPKWLLTTDPDRGKVERAIAQTPKLERKRVYLPTKAPWLETFEAEVAAFPFSKYADQVDERRRGQLLRDVDEAWVAGRHPHRNVGHFDGS